MGRLHWCDVVRAAACVMVVILHAAGPFVPVNSSGGWLTMPALLEAATRPAVPLFFMLSGYLWLSRDSDVTLESSTGRLMRSAIPGLFYTLVYAIFLHFVLNMSIPNPLTVPVFYHLWFFYAYLVVAGLLLVVRPSNATPGMGIVINCLILLIFAGGMSVFGLGHAFETVSGSALYLIYALAGFFVGQVKLSRSSALLAGIVFSAGVVLTAYLTNRVSLPAGGLDQRYYGYNASIVVVMSFASFYLLRYLGEKVQFGAPVVRNISAASLGIFGLHPLILHFCLEQLGRDRLSFLLVSAVPLLAAWAIATGLRHIPYGKWIA
ncbi:acyltransferase [Rhizobium panacihumi]|uniref:acyltransferase n=1 Tax=Rhizobium panacihumi TaxID=2008450 RepID=UPI003D7A91F7